MSTRAPTIAPSSSGDSVVGAAIGAIFGSIIVGVCILICIVKIQRKLHRNKVAPLDASTFDYHGKNSLERGSLSALPTTSNIHAQQPPSSHIIDMTKDGNNGLSEHTTQKLVAERAKHPSIMIQGVPSPLIPPQHRDSTQFENVGLARRESEDQHRIHNAAVYAQQQRMIAAQKKKMMNAAGNIPESVQESPRSLVPTEHSHPHITESPRHVESTPRHHSTERSPKPRAEKNVIAVIRPGGTTPRSSEIHIASTPRANDIQTTTTTSSSPKTTDSVIHDTPTISPLSPVAQTPRGRRVVTALAVADDDVTE